MKRKIERQRLQALFADLERISADLAGDTPEFRQEIESLRTRLSELEKQIQDSEQERNDDVRSPVDAVANQNLTKALLYEKDRVGYAYTEEKLQELYKSGYSLPEIQDVISSPLTVSGDVIGEMQIAPPDNRELSPDEMLLTKAIAQQASIQIQNLRLLAEAERSRVEAESATRRFIHEGWDSYLDAVERSERIGFTYDQSGIAPYSQTLHPNGEGVQASVKILEEQVGTLYVQPDDEKPLSDSDRELVDAVAEQVAQQVENIRLLADAARARARAEEAVRGLAHDNWQKFSEDHDESEMAFVYDSLDVKPLKDNPLQEELKISHPLIVSGEPIGQLGVAGLENPPNGVLETIASIATQTSIHLEALRLTEELKKRAEELKELDRLKSAFLANMSHELRTPLNSILGFTDVMLEELDGPLTEYMNNDLRLIQKNGQHLLHLINDVLDMAKIESGRMNLHPEKFTVHSVLDEVTSITSTLASERNVSLFIDEKSDREVEIFADNTRLRQVIINLVNNAIKFTEKGKIIMNVKKKDGATVLIAVRDTGLGIPPHMLESIFEEFSQVDTSTTRKVGGTGLGLPISRRLVEMHGGRLWAESTGVPGEGSTFFVEMPLEARITEVIEKQEK